MSVGRFVYGRYNYKTVSKWEVREVPKVIPKYIGRQEEIFIEVPQVKIVDKTVEREVPIYVGEKIVRKEVSEEMVSIYIYLIEKCFFLSENFGFF